MSRLLTFIFLGWIINKVFRILFPISKRSEEIPSEKVPSKSRQNMDIQDAECEDVE